uniref:Fibrinogen-related protein 7-1 n=1 Tax=Biomphalaria glabrata TaxID=6526 RepID=Q8WQX7_BIOGL|nr:fibrinogen-related protein 7-1 precursor [Biomphalaria glabrata]
MTNLLLRLVFFQSLLPLLSSELVIDVQPDIISAEITAQLVINCSVTNNQVQHLDVIRSLTLSRYNQTLRDFEDITALDLLTLNLKQLVKFKHSHISFGNVFISLTLLYPTQFDANVYRCSVKGGDPNNKDMSLFSKKTVEYETNSTALVEEIRRYKIDENKCLCSLASNDRTSTNKRLRVNFSGNSEIIKERVETLTLNCTFQVLNQDQNETSSLQSLYILHETNGVIANINKGQPVLKGSHLKDAQGNIFDSGLKDSYLQVTWSNVKLSDSGKYFCEANVKHSDGRAERLSEMLILTVVSPTVDDLVKVIEKLLGQVDEDTKHIQENKQNIKNIKEELKTKEQNILSNTADLNSTQQTIRSMKEDIAINQHNMSSLKEFVDANLESLQSIKEDLNIQQRNIISVKEDIAINQQNISSIKTDVAVNEENLINLQKDFNIQQRNISSIKEDFKTFYKNTSSFQEIILANLSATLEKVKNETELLHPTSCRKVIYKEDRAIVTLASGLKVMCDTKTDGGGWIIFQRRVNGSVDFYRGWQEYRDGFGDYNIGEFYLGNENIFKLTSTGKYNLRIDLVLKNQPYYAQYSIFQILSEKNHYKINVGGYSGNAGNSLSYHNDMYFSTFDNDNDAYSGVNCAVKYHGAWWYKTCYESNLNGKWGSSERDKDLNWNTLLQTAHVGVSFTEMKIRERE